MTVLKKKIPNRRHDDVNHHDKAKANLAAKNLGEEAFLSFFDAIIVGDIAEVDFDGSIKRAHMQFIWTWLSRDIKPEILQDLNGIVSVSAAKVVLQPVLVDLFAKASDAVLAGTQNPVAERHLIAQIGGEEVKDRLPIILNAFRTHTIFAKAINFGKASNKLKSEEELSEALLSLPLKEPRISPMLFHAIVGNSVEPSRLILAATHITGGSSEAVLKAGGFAPLVEGILSHAQNQISIIDNQKGLFGDVDLVCKSIARFHHLMRAVTGYVEMGRMSYWNKIATKLTALMAQRIEPRLNNVSFNVNASLRKPRNGPDVIDSELSLSALNGLYLLSAIRLAKESLALNAIFEKTWTEVGRNLEILNDRNMELFKQNSADKIISQRLDLGIEMAGLRFGKEYAEVLGKAKETVGRR